MSELVQLLPLLPTNDRPETNSQRLRRELLEIMLSDVNIRLDDSLYYQELIQLRREDQWKKVGQPAPMRVKPHPIFLKQWLQPERSLEIFGRSKTQLEQGKKIIEVFERDDIAGRLLILGAPGSGKTTTLLELARDLIQRAQHHPEHAIPVLFELTDWKDNKQTFADWLSADLKFRHNIPKAMTRKWIKTGQLLPLVDGLDDLKLTRRKVCLQKIKEFLEAGSAQSSLVLCCPQEEYIEGKAILGKLGGAISLQPLTDRQIESYLRRVGYGYLWPAIEEDPEGLLELAKMPLLLNLIPVACSDGLRPIGRRFSDPTKHKECQEQCRQDLFDAYIKRRLEKPHNRQGYELEDAKRWLIWLAKTIKKQNKAEFLIEDMQPYLLETIQQKRLYQIFSGLISGIILGLISGLIGGGIIGWICGLMGGLIYGFINPIKVADIPILSWDKPEGRLSLGISFALIIGLIIWLIFGLTLWLIKYLFFWLFFGLLTGLIIGLIVRTSEDKIQIRNKPNQGIKESAKNTIIISLISCPAGMLLYALLRVAIGQTVEPLMALNSGVSLALFFGMAYGGLACIQHCLLRLILWLSGSIPWNYSHFLSYAADRQFIKQVGGRYRFIHDLLRSHFAEMPDS
jgi:DNA polymerase III delta prime subunit